jgi:endonuclease-3
MDETAIKNRLVERGTGLFAAPRKPSRFTGIEEADRLLNDIDAHPHAFVLASLMDRQIKAERAWLIPYRFQEKIGSLSMAALSALTLDRVRDLMSKPEPLHRFVENMSGIFFAGIKRIVEVYDGHASAIWAGQPSSATVVYRFLEFDGAGPKIATMAANILARDFKVPFSDYFSVDVSPDVHIGRVFWRLGLTPKGAGPEQLVYRARSLHPEFPGLLDLPAWEIGRAWCKPSEPRCHLCYMNDICVGARR